MFLKEETEEILLLRFKIKSTKELRSFTTVTGIKAEYISDLLCKAQTETLFNIK